MLELNDLRNDPDKPSTHGTWSVKFHLARWKKWKSQRRKKQDALEDKLTQIKKEEQEFMSWLRNDKEYITRDELREILTKELNRRSS